MLYIRLFRTKQEEYDSTIHNRTNSYCSKYQLVLNSEVTEKELCFFFVIIGCFSCGLLNFDGYMIIILEELHIGTASYIFHLHTSNPPLKFICSITNLVCYYNVSFFLFILGLSKRQEVLLSLIWTISSLGILEILQAMIDNGIYYTKIKMNTNVYCCSFFLSKC